MTNEELWLYTLCKKNNVFITDIQLKQLFSFKNLLLDWNQKINLISRKNEENLWKGHIALSLSMLFKIEFNSGMKILDLGTGGGFPGIPLAIMLPECSFLLLDSTSKKIMAVESMVESLSLCNVKTIWGRAEDLQKQRGLQLSFDAVVARSVSSLSNLLDWGLPFLKNVTGAQDEIQHTAEKMPILLPSLITFKGAEIEEEEKLAQKKYPHVHLRNIPLHFSGSEEFENLDKKLTIATKK